MKLLEIPELLEFLVPGNLGSTPQNPWIPRYFRLHFPIFLKPLSVLKLLISDILITELLTSALLTTELLAPDTLTHDTLTTNILTSDTLTSDTSTHYNNVSDTHKTRFLKHYVKKTLTYSGRDVMI